MISQDGPQAKRVRELIKTYASFHLMPAQDKARVTHLCGILAYLEIAESQNMSLKNCLKGVQTFLDQIRKKYVNDNDKDEGNVLIT